MVIQITMPWQIVLFSKIYVMVMKMTIQIQHLGFRNSTSFLKWIDVMDDRCLIDKQMLMFADAKLGCEAVLVLCRK